MAPGLVFLAHFLVLAFLSVTARWGSACLAVEIMWVTVCILTVLLFPEAIGGPASEFTSTHVHPDCHSHPQPKVP